VDGAGVPLCEAVDLTADRLDRDVEITAVWVGACSAEHEVLDQMGDAVLSAALVSRARTNHQRTGDRVDVGEAQHQDRETVGEPVPDELEHGSISRSGADPVNEDNR
jgi:hypothetical protein